jgi:hypothetical protein
MDNLLNGKGFSQNADEIEMISRLGPMETWHHPKARNWG